MPPLEKALRAAVTAADKAHTQAREDEKAADKVRQDLRGAAGKAASEEGYQFEQALKAEKEGKSVVKPGVELQGELGRAAERNATEVARKTHDASTAAWDALDQAGGTGKYLKDLKKKETREARKAGEGSGAQA